MDDFVVRLGIAVGGDVPDFPAGTVHRLLNKAVVGPGVGRKRDVLDFLLKEFGESRVGSTPRWDRMRERGLSFIICED